MFADADDQYARLDTVKARLATWQEKYPTTFRDAYGPASAPALFAPFVRAQLLQWDPLRASEPGAPAHASVGVWNSALHVGQFPDCLEPIRSGAKHEGYGAGCQWCKPLSVSAMRSCAVHGLTAQWEDPAAPGLGTR